MKRRHVLTVLLAVAALVAGLALLPAYAAPGRSPTEYADDDPGAVPEIRVPEMYRVAEGASTGAEAGQTATIWFTPEDNNNSTTVIFLYNTTTAAATVNMASFALSGAAGPTATVQIPARNFVRFISDAIDPAAPVSWQSAGLWNFTDAYVYASLTLPPGVHVQAYVAYPGNMDLYDPNDASPKVPLRFSSDPATVALPGVMK